MQMNRCGIGEMKLIFAGLSCPVLESHHGSLPLPTCTAPFREFPGCTYLAVLDMCQHMDPSLGQFMTGFDKGSIKGTGKVDPS